RVFHVTGVQTCALPISGSSVAGVGDQPAVGGACGPDAGPVRLDVRPGMGGVCPAGDPDYAPGRDPLHASQAEATGPGSPRNGARDRKSTRLNSSHVKIS